MSEILTVGTIVACNMYGMVGGGLLPANQKRAFGIVLGQTPRTGVPWEKGKTSWQVQLLFYPDADMEGSILGFLEEDLRVVTQTVPGKRDLASNWEAIALFLLRELESLADRVFILERLFGMHE